ncbi:MAG: hypothetical protein GF341_01860 [candidate division Zixibacteria bacterium]|nr:hypothetical protein [candidate division Zixibacteria bacterium]
MRRRNPVLCVLLGVCTVVVLAGFTSASHAADSDYERDLIERVRATFGRIGMAASAEPVIPIKCGTPIAYEIRQAWPTLTPWAKQQIAADVDTTRPQLDEFYDFETPEGNFRIHYTRTGPDAVDMSFGVGEGNVPVYVLTCADYFDTVVAKEITEMGFIFPVSDQEGVPSQDPRYDIYFRNLGSLFYGITWPEQIVGPAPGGAAARQTSYLELNSDFSQIQGYQNRPFDAMAVTIAHEFHHAIQWSYDAVEAEFRELRGELRPYSWFFELTSTYLEDVVFDHVNDYYNYLEFFYLKPWLSLRVFVPSAGSGTIEEILHCYGSAVFGLYLHERFDESIMADVWDICGSKQGFNTFEALDEALMARGSSFEEAWAEFLVWNYHTGPRAETWGFEEGAAYDTIPSSYVPVYSEYPVEGSSSGFVYPEPDELSGAYFRFITGLGTDDFNFLLESDFNEWMVVTAGLRGGLPPDITYTRDLIDGATVPSWSRYDEILVVVSPFKNEPKQDALDREIAYSFEVPDTLTTSASVSAIHKIYSNPLNLSTGTGGSVFEVEVSLAEPADVSMYIYTPSGQLVRGGPEDGMAKSNVSLGKTRLRWSGVNRDNQRVASGIYLALVKIGDKEEVVKVAVINNE